MPKQTFKEYTWDDIQQLIFKDVGLCTEDVQKEHGEIWCLGGFGPPLDGRIIEVKVHERTKKQRLGIE